MYVLDLRTMWPVWLICASVAAVPASTSNRGTSGATGFVEGSVLTPEEITFANKNVVMPPKMQLGIESTQPPNLAKTPSTINHNPDPECACPAGLTGSHISQGYHAIVLSEGGKRHAECQRAEDAGEAIVCQGSLDAPHQLRPAGGKLRNSRGIRNHSILGGLTCGCDVTEAMSMDVIMKTIIMERIAGT